MSAKSEAAPGAATSAKDRVEARDASRDESSTAKERDPEDVLPCNTRLAPSALMDELFAAALAPSNSPASERMECVAAMADQDHTSGVSKFVRAYVAARRSPSFETAFLLAESLAELPEALRGPSPKTGRNPLGEALALTLEHAVYGRLSVSQLENLLPILDATTRGGLGTANELRELCRTTDENVLAVALVLHAGPRLKEAYDAGALEGIVTPNGRPPGRLPIPVAAQLAQSAGTALSTTSTPDLQDRVRAIHMGATTMFCQPRRFYVASTIGTDHIDTQEVASIQHLPSCLAILDDYLALGASWRHANDPAATIARDAVATLAEIANGARSREVAAALYARLPKLRVGAAGSRLLAESLMVIAAFEEDDSKAIAATQEALKLFPNDPDSIQYLVRYAKERKERLGFDLPTSVVAVPGAQ